MKKLIVLIFVICFMASCNKNKISPEYLIVSNTDVASNKEGLMLVSEMIKEIQQDERTMINRDNVHVSCETVEIAAEVIKLFNPDNFDCPLPKKIKSRLKESTWAPAFVTGRVNKLPKYALHFDGASISVLINSITLKKPDGSERNIVVLGAPSYSNFNVQNYLDNNQDEFTYTLDYSGYMNAALTASVNAGGAEINQSAKLCMDKSGMLMLARGFIFSPLIAALRPNASAQHIFQDNYQRLATLFSIMEALPSDYNEQDKIIAPLEYDLMWSSVSGNSSFNGEGSLKSNAGGSLGVVSASFNSAGGASFSRQTSFKEYDTYILNSKELKEADPVSLAEIKSNIEALTKRAVIEKPCEITNGRIKFALRFPKGFADLDWSIRESGYSIDNIALDESNLCAFIVNGPSNNASGFITIHSEYKGIDLEHKILLP